LSRWATNGVLLLNRTLTTSIGDRNAHVMKGWSSLTLSVAELLAERKVVAILWGNNARELAPLFPHRIESAHPSPLSARRGFFGSRPFSRANLALAELGRPPIDWKL
jgi:uracil-DNA glycosylase